MEQQDDVYEELKERALKELRKNLRDMQRTYVKKFERLRLAKNDAKTKQVLQELEQLPDAFRKKLLSYTQIAKKIANTVAYIVNYPAKCTIIKIDAPNAAAVVTDPEVEYASHVEVYVTSGLFEVCNGKEFVAVLLHECGHLLFFSKKLFSRHSLASALILIAGLIATYVANYIHRRRKGKGLTSPQALIVFLASTFILTFPTLGLLYAPIRRAEERVADATAVQYGYGEYLASALKKMVYKKRSKVLSTPKWLHFLKKVLSYILASEYDTNEQRLCKIYAYTLSTLDKRSPEYLRIKAQMKADHCERYL